MKCPAQNHLSAASTAKKTPGFTLIEVLVVLALIIAITMLAMPAVTGIMKGGNLSAAVYDIQGILEFARGYAKQNNTYVFVGIAEWDSSQNPTANPKTDGIGRVAIAVVASQDGTRTYDIDNIAAGATLSNGLIAISKLRYFDSLHLADLTSAQTGNMIRPTPSTDDTITYNMGDSSCEAATHFNWPPTGTPQYEFKKVINFDPQGVARIQTSTNTDTVQQVIEIGLRQSRGNVAPRPLAEEPGNQAAIQIDCMSGISRIYRP